MLKCWVNIGDIVRFMTLGYNLGGVENFSTRRRTNILFLIAYVYFFKKILIIQYSCGQNYTPPNWDTHIVSPIILH